MRHRVSDDVYTHRIRQIHKAISVIHGFRIVESPNKRDYLLTSKQSQFNLKNNRFSTTSKS